MKEKLARLGRLGTALVAIGVVACESETPLEPTSPPPYIVAGENFVIERQTPDEFRIVSRADQPQLDQLRGLREGMVTLGRFGCLPRDGQFPTEQREDNPPELNVKIQNPESCLPNVPSLNQIE